MKLCYGERLAHLRRSGELRIECDDGAIMLDDFRIGLRLGPVIRSITGPVDLSDPSPPTTTDHPTTGFRLDRGMWCLARSRERIGLSERLIGIMNTRSKFARLGLELACSSWIIAPGFGMGEPTSLVFEMHAATSLHGFTETDCYGFFFVMECDQPVVDATTPKSYGDRFPLRLLFG